MFNFMLPHSAFVLPIASAVGEGSDMTHLMMRLVLQLAVVLLAARMGGLIVHHYLKGPMVLGELAAGMLIGPHALGGLSLAGLQPLFPRFAEGMSISAELYGIATVASIILLFLTGLETDLATFLRYSVVGLWVGTGGLVGSFILGNLCSVWFGLADGFMDPVALFMGTMSTATSVGLTARILSERKKMGSPEGVTILAGAVLDDVLGIVILAVVVGMVNAEKSGHALHWGRIGWLMLKAVGFWLGFTTLGLLAAPMLSRQLKRLESMETISVICIGLALLMAGLFEMAGLAMIIGAYIAGLALSKTDFVFQIEEQVDGIYNFLTPVFFCVMGMLVDFSSMRESILFGIIFSLLAILSKLIGCGLPALCMRFNLRGALRIGVGMVPRGEVALIVAGIGLSSGVIGPSVFGVAVMMTLLTTMMAPPLLIQAFKGGSGIRGKSRMPDEDVQTLTIELPSEDVADFLRRRITAAFRQEEFFVHQLHMAEPTFQIRKENMAFTLVQEGDTLTVNASKADEPVARLIMAEEILSLQDLFESAQKMQNPGQVGQDLLSGLFT